MRAFVFRIFFHHWLHSASEQEKKDGETKGEERRAPDTGEASHKTIRRYKNASERAP